MSDFNKEKEQKDGAENKVILPYYATGKHPQYSNPFAAGLDLSYAGEETITLTQGAHVTVGTGVHVQLPERTFGLVAIRSGLGMKGLVLANGVGVIDEDYRGEIRMPMFYHGEGTLQIEPGERVAQMIIIPYLHPDLVEAYPLEETERGEEGFGSSGRF